MSESACGCTEKTVTTELLAPAGDFETALSAFAAGADAVYCGLADFSARAFAKNFSVGEMRDLMRYARAKGKRVYVTFNTVVDEGRVGDAVEALSTLSEIGPDALIVQDLGIAGICHRFFPELQLHASTQLVAHNLEGVLALGDLGFSRVVLARELSLNEIASIVKRCGDVEIECFIHGALCYSISGLCLFGAMERDRSGNRGMCPYCCRQAFRSQGGENKFAFSMKDLRIGEGVRRLVDAGVSSLKIEGRMKSSLYVSSVTKYYRGLIDDGAVPKGHADAPVTPADLETVFSRRTTSLYFNGKNGADDLESPIDPVSIGHLGAAIGNVKRITKDREGRRWLRFHTLRALERHDGLQFANPEGGKPHGFGIADMRTSISRQSVFEVAAGTDVEIALPNDADFQLKAGDTVYCSMSNAVKRRFPVPGFRSAEYPGVVPIDIEVVITAEQIAAKSGDVTVSVSGKFLEAKSPEKTFDAVKASFSKLGGTNYQLGKIIVSDVDKRFVPASVLNDLRRDLIDRLDRQIDERQRRRLSAVLDASASVAGGRTDDLQTCFHRTIKVRLGQTIPPGEWDEVVVAVGAAVSEDSIAGLGLQPSEIRLALPVYTGEFEFNGVRNAVKRLVRAGYRRWEASNLATLRVLLNAGVSDITADWTLYAFNSHALSLLSELGVKRFVASPENNRENLQFLAESGFDVECIVQQSTPLFISLTRPADQDELSVFRRDGLWVTTKPAPRVLDAPDGMSTRVDLSWDPEASC